MFWKRNLIAVAFAIAFLEIMTNILTNVATNILPDNWKSSLWISWPLLGICYLTIFGLKKWKDYSTNSDNKIAASPDTQIQEAPTSGKGRQQVTSSDGSGSLE